MCQADFSWIALTEAKGYWAVEWTDSVVHEEDSIGVPCEYDHWNVQQIQHGSELKRMNLLSARPKGEETIVWEVALESNLILILILIMLPSWSTVD